MKSQKWRSIILKNPSLQRIRTNLRVLLKKAVESELHSLLKSKDECTDVFKTKKLIESINSLTHAWTQSILICSESSMCKSVENNELNSSIATLSKDMVWNPILKGWNCIDCYNSYYKTETQKEILSKAVHQERIKRKKFEEWFFNQIKTF
ncbi:MAG: hypothetical protein ACFFCI_22935 [Promethearchaeota archaeon]